jgi:hypothetical protein
MFSPKAFKMVLANLAVYCLCGCSTIYYNFWEYFGVEKHDLLKDEVVEAKESQEDAQQHFKSTLDRLELYDLKMYL